MLFAFLLPFCMFAPSLRFSWGCDLSLSVLGFSEYGVFPFHAAKGMSRHSCPRFYRTYCSSLVPLWRVVRKAASDVAGFAIRNNDARTPVLYSIVWRDVGHFILQDKEIVPF